MRQYVLSLPNADVKEIVATELKAKSMNVKESES